MRQGGIPPAGESPPKGFSLGRYLARRRERMARFHQFTGATVEEAAAAGMLTALRLEFEIPAAAESVLLRSIEERAGPGRLTYKGLLALLGNLEHNRGYILNGETVPRWSGKPDIWTVAGFTEVTEVRIKDRPFAVLHLACHHGVAAGDEYRIMTTVKYARWLAKEIGYPRYERAHERDLGGMAAWVKLTVTRHGRTALAAAEATELQQERNRRLARARMAKRCALRTVACHMCRLGRDKCPLACRPESLEQHKDKIER